MIADIKIGTSFHGEEFLVVEAKHLRAKNNNDKPYTLLELRDKSGSVMAFIWEEHVPISSGAFIKASGTAKKRENEVVLQINSSSITQISEPETIENFVNSLDSVTVIKLWEELLSIRDGIQDKTYKAIISKLINEHEKIGYFNLRTCPLSDEKYGAYCGALIEHIVYCCRHAKKIQQNYFDRNSPIDPDLLLTILILHDIGRLKGFSNPLNIKKSTEAKLLSLTTLSVLITKDLARDICDEQKLNKLLHGITAASNKEHSPMFIEAMLAQKIQEMDALVGIFSNAVNFTKRNQEFTKTIEVLGYELYSI